MSLSYICLGMVARLPFVFKFITLSRYTFLRAIWRTTRRTAKFALKKDSKHQGTKFHKIIDFIGTAHVFCHSCRNVYSMIFALRTRKTRIYCFHGFPGYCILYTKRSISHQWWMPQWPESETWICNSSNHDQLQRTMITSRWKISNLPQNQIKGKIAKCPKSQN